MRDHMYYLRIWRGVFAIWINGVELKHIHTHTLTRTHPLCLYRIILLYVFFFWKKKSVQLKSWRMKWKSSNRWQIVSTYYNLLFIWNKKNGIVATEKIDFLSSIVFPFKRHRRFDWFISDCVDKQVSI